MYEYCGQWFCATFSLTEKAWFGCKVSIKSLRMNSGYMFVSICECLWADTRYSLQTILGVASTMPFTQRNHMEAAFQSHVTYKIRLHLPQRCVDTFVWDNLCLQRGRLVGGPRHSSLCCAADNDIVFLTATTRAL